jgi:hypothetical protein
MEPMPELSKDVVALLQYLAPGLIVAWIYYGVTSHDRPSQFERVVQALIYTVLIQAIVFCERFLVLKAGAIVSFGEWTPQSELCAALFTAIIAGLLAGVVSNRDTLHSTLRRLGATTRTAHPCEWFTVFSAYPRFVVLQLRNGTRVYGWPEVWPSDNKKGHFFMKEAMRTVDGIEQDLPHLEGLLVDANDVEYVEFLNEPEEATS